MDYFPSTTHFLLRATRESSVRGQTPAYVPVGTFAVRSSAENCVRRLSKAQAFEGYVLTEESVRSLTHGSAVLNTVTYDTRGIAVMPRTRARGGALPG